MRRAAIIASNGFGREAANLLWDTEFEAVAAASPNGGVGSILARKLGVGVRVEALIAVERGLA